MKAWRAAGAHQGEGVMPRVDGQQAFGFCHVQGPPQAEVRPCSKLPIGLQTHTHYERRYPLHRWRVRHGHPVPGTAEAQALGVGGVGTAKA